MVEGTGIEPVTCWLRRIWRGHLSSTRTTHPAVKSTKTS